MLKVAAAELVLQKLMLWRLALVLMLAELALCVCVSGLLQARLTTAPDLACLPPPPPLGLTGHANACARVA